MNDKPKPTAGELLPEFVALGFKRKIDQSTTSEWTADADGVLLPMHRFVGQYANEIAEAHNAALAVEEKRANDSIEENVRLMNRLAAERSKNKPTTLQQAAEKGWDELAGALADRPKPKPTAGEWTAKSEVK